MCNNSSSHSNSTIRLSPARTGVKYFSPFTISIKLTRLVYIYIYFSFEPVLFSPAYMLLLDL